MIEFNLDHRIVAGYEEVADIVGSGYFEGPRTSSNSGIGLYAVCPGWNGFIRWVSSGNEAGFAFFDKYFERLEVASMACP